MKEGGEGGKGRKRLQTNPSISPANAAPDWLGLSLLRNLTETLATQANCIVTQNTNKKLFWFHTRVL